MMKLTYSQISTECIDHGQKGNHKGYGTGRYMGTKCGAHVAAYLQCYGYIPSGMCLLHMCDNPRCINPSHLLVGTHQDNTNDARKKGRYIGRPPFSSVEEEDNFITEVIRLQSTRKAAILLGIPYGTAEDIVNRGKLRGQIQIQGTRRRPQYGAGGTS